MSEKRENPSLEEVEKERKLFNENLSSASIGLSYEMMKKWNKDSELFQSVLRDFFINKSPLENNFFRTPEDKKAIESMKEISFDRPGC